MYTTNYTKIISIMGEWRVVPHVFSAQTESNTYIMIIIHYKGKLQQKHSIATCIMRPQTALGHVHVCIILCTYMPVCYLYMYMYTMSHTAIVYMMRDHKMLWAHAYACTHMHSH